MQTTRVSFDINRIEVVNVLTIAMAAGYRAKSLDFNYTPFREDDLEISDVVMAFSIRKWECDQIITRDDVDGNPAVLRAFDGILSLFDKESQKENNLRVKVSNKDGAHTIELMAGHVVVNSDIHGLMAVRDYRKYTGIEATMHGLLTAAVEVPAGYRDIPSYTTDEYNWQHYIALSLRLAWDTLPFYLQASLAAFALKQANAYIDRRAKNEIS